MPNRALYENWVSVLLFAVVGTVWNCIAIGTFSMFHVSVHTLQIN
ncbi:unnamed protein product [Cylicostephanus goldi]|uniref:Uncharacterized protein n=1 Tax=Cylicostephanus goldi TaxID=71465 RepID=A0A3P7QAP9_CYLGO|nr:unnamed protein product [Cylicostephanus goldi]